MQFVVASLLFVSSALAANLPTFTYNSGDVQISAIATDSAGNTYITGTGSIAATPGAFQSQHNTGLCAVGGGGIGPPIAGSCPDVVIIKLDPTGAVIFATYLGGNGQNTANAIAVDQQGNVYVAGGTSGFFMGQSNTFPITPGAAFTNWATASGFVTKLNPSGTQLVYSTFIPQTVVVALAVDLEGNAYITGTVGIILTPPVIAAFPTTAGAFQVSPKAGNPYPGIVAKLNASGSALAYATYLSGSGRQGDYPAAIAVDAIGDAFIAGQTSSADFPVTPGAFLTTSPGQGSPFLTKLNPQGSSLVYSTYTSSGGTSVKVDGQGTAFVLGDFLMRFSADGSSLIYSTAVPIPYTVPVLDVDGAGNAAIAETVLSANLPVGVGAFQPEFTGGMDGYVAKFTPEGQLSAATYLGGARGALAQAIALAPNGSVVVAGNTNSSDFPGIAQPFAGDYVTSIFISLTALNAASYVPNTIAPGEIVSLLGYGIGSETGVIATGSTLPTELGGVQVSFGGFPAPLLYSQSHVINAQVPWELAGQTSTSVVVSYPGVASTPTPIALAPSLPGILYVNNSDGTQNSPSNPAKPGDFITIYGTGGGPTSPAGIDGAFWSLTTPYPLLTLPVIVTIGSGNASVLYAGASPLSSSGVFQINALLPSNLPASSASSLVVNIGGASSVAVPIAIQ
jgi:uncharacterized protein (TIGR03437 family)